MARLEWLQRQIEGIKEEHVIENREHSAAVRLQSWFRGCQVRARLRLLHRKATIIQKVWRGFRARNQFRQMVKKAYFVMKMNFYNEMAIRIQRRWRGYYVRKYIHNYYALKRYLEGLTIKNEQVRKDLEEFAELQRREMERLAREREGQRKCLQAQRLHFLLSTEQCPGVFNSPYRDFPHEMELRLRSIKPLLAKNAPLRRDSGGSPACSLPPVPSKKPQGPFRDPAEVLQQRYRPLEPTLRVATSITALEEAREELRREEWRSRVIDDIFQPFSNAHKNRKYERTLHGTSSYEQVDYGTKYFREENKEKRQGEKLLFFSLGLSQNHPGARVHSPIHVVQLLGQREQSTVLTCVTRSRGS
ncbi:spermatogenesis-associated protein 17 isoform X1 [Scleropages formosus]|uniref:spermatogenesis-associated protein 17 isoform X1 n=1 Tax=Scleropages formosus TaxID=113540 RepID=UPI0010FAA7E5|nr:spermatogenesis-associated protein 17 isoform X1 [Scleropages formosus]